jgi:hypothetical protein
LENSRRDLQDLHYILFASLRPQQFSVEKIANSASIFAKLSKFNYNKFAVLRANLDEQLSEFHGTRSSNGIRRNSAKKLKEHQHLLQFAEILCQFPGI